MKNNSTRTSAGRSGNSGAVILQAALLAASILAAAPETSVGEVGSRPLALVNGIPIFNSDLDCAVEASLSVILAGHEIRPEDKPAKPPASVSGAALDNLIAIELLYQESLKHRFYGLSAEVDERYRREIERIGGESRLQAALRCNEMTPDSFRKALFRNLSIGRLLESNVYSRIAVSEDEVRSYYRDNTASFQVPAAVRLRQILIRVSSWKDDAAVGLARQKAEQIAAEASVGSDFSALARRYSQDPSGGTRGGEIGIVRQGYLGPAFDEEIFSLPVLGVTRPIRSRYGFHVYKVLDIYPAASRPLDEVRATIVSRLRREKAGAMTQELINRLRAEADIRIDRQENQEEKEPGP